MDYQHRAGGKTGSGGMASFSDANVARKERLKQIAMDVIDIDKDPYFMRNHLGTYECKLCLTLHNNPESYLTHTQGKKHQSNLQKRAAEQAKENPIQPSLDKPRVEYKKFVKIGRPGYKVTKQRDPKSGQQSMLFQVDYPEIATNILPLHRFMSAYEQRVEAPDKRWQYLLFAAEPYETIAFKIPSRELDKDTRKFWHYWNTNSKQFYLQIAFKIDPANSANANTLQSSKQSKSNAIKEIEEQKMKAASHKEKLLALSNETAKYSGAPANNPPRPGMPPPLMPTMSPLMQPPPTPNMQIPPPLNPNMQPPPVPNMQQHMLPPTPNMPTPPPNPPNMPTPPPNSNMPPQPPTTAPMPMQPPSSGIMAPMPPPPGPNMPLPPMPNGAPPPPPANIMYPPPPPQFNQ